jgi:hypothetical protein
VIGFVHRVHRGNRDHRGEEVEGEEGEEGEEEEEEEEEEGEGEGEGEGEEEEEEEEEEERDLFRILIDLQLASRCCFVQLIRFRTSLCALGGPTLRVGRISAIRASAASKSNRYCLPIAHSLFSAFSVSSVFKTL